MAKKEKVPSLRVAAENLLSGHNRGLELTAWKVDDLRAALALEASRESARKELVEAAKKSLYAGYRGRQALRAALKRVKEVGA